MGNKQKPRKRGGKSGKKSGGGGHNESSRAAAAEAAPGAGATTAAAAAVEIERDSGGGGADKRASKSAERGASGSSSSSPAAASPSSPDADKSADKSAPGSSSSPAAAPASSPPGAPLSAAVSRLQRAMEAISVHSAGMHAPGAFDIHRPALHPPFVRAAVGFCAVIVRACADLEADREALTGERGAGAGGGAPSSPREALRGLLAAACETAHPEGRAPEPRSVDELVGLLLAPVAEWSTADLLLGSAVFFAPVQGEGAGLPTTMYEAVLPGGDGAVLPQEPRRGGGGERGGRRGALGARVGAHDAHAAGDGVPDEGVARAGLGGRRCERADALGGLGGGGGSSGECAGAGAGARVRGRGQRGGAVGPQARGGGGRPRARGGGGLAAGGRRGRRAAARGGGGGGAPEEAPGAETQVIARGLSGRRPVCVSFARPHARLRLPVVCAPVARPSLAFHIHAHAMSCPFGLWPRSRREGVISGGSAAAARRRSSSIRPPLLSFPPPPPFFSKQVNVSTYHICHMSTKRTIIAHQVKV
jgi:hypothetical protein